MFIYFINVIKNEFLIGVCDFIDMFFVYMIVLICFVYNRGVFIIVLLLYFLLGIYKVLVVL